jgi:hypothetical protein
MDQDELIRESILSTASIIKYRSNQIRKIERAIKRDIIKLYNERGLRNRILIRGDISDKLIHMEIMISKNIDDIYSIELIKGGSSVKPHTDTQESYIY